MARFFRRSASLSLAALTLLLALSQAAVAQRDEGRRERGGERRGGMAFLAPLVSLATNEEVEDELKLSDEQKDKIEELSDDLRDDFRKLLESGGQHEERQALNKAGSQKLIEVLDEDQEKRITEIAIQVFGANTLLFHPTLADHINVTEEQRKKLDDAQQENRRAFGEAWRDMRDQDLSREEARTKFGKLRAEADEKLMDVLTPEQKKQLESLKGEKADIDLPQFRPGRGGRDDRNRDRDRDGDRGRDRGNRERDNDTGDDASSSS
jgi:Spy/CpxP family protein refolding chaperone